MEASEFDHVRVEREERIAEVTVDRPASRNAMDVPTRRELRAVFEALREEGAVRAVILRGAGEGNFVSGGDVERLNEMELAEALEYADRYVDRLYNYLADYPLPVIAAVDGHALGGGLELALACDVRIATPDAVFGLPEVTLGILPSGGGTQRLQAIAGAGVARELVLTGRTIDAAEARDHGLVNHVFDEAEFDAATRSLAEEFASNAPVAVRLAKEAMNRGLDIESGLALERTAFALAVATRDKDEGTKAFLEDRDPSFEGR